MKEKYTDRCKSYRIYSILGNEKGERYVVSNLNLLPIEYDPLLCMDDILLSLLSIGRDYAAGNDIDFTVQSFCMKYGLLGFEDASIEKEYDDGSVKFYAGNVFGMKAATKEQRRMMFNPFPKRRNQQYKTHSAEPLIELPAPDSKEIFAVVPDFYNVEAVRWYGIYGASLYELFRKKQAGDTMTLLPGNAELRYKIADGAGKRKLYFDSLKSACDYAVLELLTSPTPSIRLCKRCGKPLLTHGTRSDYCSVSCRNVTNVANSRKRKEKY